MIAAAAVRPPVHLDRQTNRLTDWLSDGVRRQMDGRRREGGRPDDYGKWIDR